MQTLVQLNSLLEKIARDHVQINSYGFGTGNHFEEALMNDESLFPCVWVELGDPSADRGIFTRSVDIHITDVNANQVEAFSKTEQIALDIFNMLNIMYSETGMDVVLAFSLQPLEYRGVDHSHGYAMNLSIDYVNEGNACLAPASPNTEPGVFKVWSTIEKKWIEKLN